MHLITDREVAQLNGLRLRYIQKDIADAHEELPKSRTNRITWEMLGLDVRVNPPWMAGNVELPVKYRRPRIMKYTDYGNYIVCDWYPMLKGMEGAVMVLKDQNDTGPAVAAYFLPDNCVYKPSVNKNPPLLCIAAGGGTWEGVYNFRPIGEWWEVI